MILKLAMMVMC